MLMEAILVLAVLGQQYKLRSVNSYAHTEPLVSLRVKDGLKLQISRRIT
ncbi:hypothetical protein [Ectobacillus panaciterrae]|nr:hypothetical protein [Ectobacillus panaciterrae]